MFTAAQASLITPSARMIGTGWRSQPMGKLTIDRWVWAPQYLWLGTSSGPKLSVSVRVAVIGASSQAVLRPIPPRAPEINAACNGILRSGAAKTVARGG